MKGKKSGSSLVEFCIISPLLILCFMLFYGLNAGSLANSFLSIDLFTLKRAHLYGNDLDFCEASFFWPAHWKEKTIYECHQQNYSVQVTTPYFKIEKSLP